MKSRSLRLAAGLGFMAAAGLAAAVSSAASPAAPTAGNAALDAVMPPPGLYRVDTDATHGGPGVQARQDGASGGETIRIPGANGGALTKDFAGDGPVTRCVPNRQAVMPVPAGCSSTPPSIVNGAAHLASQCHGADIAMVIRKTGPKTWEYRTTVSYPIAAGAGAGANGGLPMPRAVLENAAAHGATAEQRAAAARVLAEHDAHAPPASSAAAAAAAGAGGARRASTIVQVATRIADSCGAGH